jgi:hypothetical protein
LQVGGFDECLGTGSRFAGAEEHDYFSRLALLGVRMRSTSQASVQHTYGYRYGLRDFYRHKRDRLGADGGLAAKRTMLRQQQPPPSVRESVIAELRSQITTIKPLRLPNNAFRLFHYLRSYRDGLEGYELAGGVSDPVVAAMSPKK